MHDKQAKRSIWSPFSSNLEQNRVADKKILLLEWKTAKSTSVPP